MIILNRGMLQFTWSHVGEITGKDFRGASIIQTSTRLLATSPFVDVQHKACSQRFQNVMTLCVERVAAEISVSSRLGNAGEQTLHGRSRLRSTPRIQHGQSGGISTTSALFTHVVPTRNHGLDIRHRYDIMDQAM